MYNFTYVMVICRILAPMSNFASIFTNPKCFKTKNLTLGSAHVSDTHTGVRIA